jgi:hypothetical protein
MIQLEIPKEEEEISIGTSKFEQAAEKKRQEDIEREEKEELDSLHKKIVKSYVGCRWFYTTFNQVFYLLVLLS